MTLIAPTSESDLNRPRRDGVAEWLEQLDIRTKLLLDDVRAGGPHRMDALRGLYLSGDDVDSIVDSARPQPAPVGVLPLALDETRQMLGLDVVDFEVMMVACAPDFDRRYEQLYGYLNDDVTTRRPTVFLAILLAGLDPLDPVARRRLASSGPLLQRGLVRLAEPDRAVLSRTLHAPDRLVSYLLGDDQPGVDTVVSRSLAVPPTDFDMNLAEAISDGVGLVYLRHRTPSTASWWAERAVTRAFGGAASVELSASEPLDGAREVCLEALLAGTGAVIGPIDAAGDSTADVLRLLDASPRPSIVVGRTEWDPSWPGPVPLVLDAPDLDPVQRVLLWDESIAATGQRVDGALEPGAATAAFRLGPAQIDRAAEAAAVTARFRDGPIDASDLTSGARLQNASGLRRLATRIDPAATWDDLVLPDLQVRALHELAGRVRHRRTVLGTWGMKRSGGRGDGLTVMFTGPSGTGKTLAAEVVGHDLGLDVHTVDVATVVDKYIGETEKNLDRIFGEAELVNTVLFFDEADALFGKRSEVRDARDRYANVEVAYLLQRMERFDGVTILATNLRLNIDDAFARRLDVVVDFPRPGPDERRRLWSVLIGHKLPLADDVDVEFLGDRFDLCGGDIRNAVITAAFLAAERDDEVGMADLVRAVGREYRKLGRLCLPTDFLEWQWVVDDDIDVDSQAGAEPPLPR